MDDESAIPASYEQWRELIEVRGKISLSPRYISKRLAELQDGNNAKTKEFAEFYGADQLQQTISWFQRAAHEARES